MAIDRDHLVVRCSNITKRAGSFVWHPENLKVEIKLPNNVLPVARLIAGLLAELLAHPSVGHFLSEG